VTGTGEALPGPGSAIWEQSARITAKREVALSREGVGWGHISDDRRDSITRPSEGPLLRPCLWEREEPVHGRKAQQPP
jgi:hypothetical protein